MRNTFFVQVILPLATAGFCALYWIGVPPDPSPTPQTRFTHKLCGLALSRSVNTGTVSWTARDPLPLPLLVTPQQLAHLLYLLSRPDARRVPEIPDIEESQDGRSEPLDDPVASQEYSDSTSPSNHVAVAVDFASPILEITGDSNVSSIYVNEQVVDPFTTQPGVGVAGQTFTHSPDDGHSNHSLVCIQQSQGDTLTLPVAGCAIQSTNSSTVMNETATIQSPTGKYIAALSLINGSHNSYQGNSSGDSPALLQIGADLAHVHSDPTSVTTNQSIDIQYSDLVSGPGSQPIDKPLVASKAKSSDTADMNSTSVANTMFVLSPLAEITGDSNSTFITTIFSLLNTHRSTALMSFLNTRFLYCACIILPLIVLSFILLFKLPVVRFHQRKDPASASVAKPMSMLIVVRRPVDAPPPPGQRQLQRRFSEPNISYSYAIFHAHRMISEAQRAESTPIIVNPIVEPHIESSVITPSSSSSTTTQSCATESTAATSVTGSPSPRTLQLKSTLSANGPRLARSFTCLTSCSVPTPKTDFFTSPSQSFDVYYAAQVSDEEWVQPSSSKFTRHGRKSGPLRRRHTTGRLSKENREQDINRAGAAYYGRKSQNSRRRYTTGRTRNGTEEPGYARTAVLVQNRVYDIDDEEGACDDGLGNHSPITRSASFLVQPSPTSEESPSQVGLGNSIG